MGQAATRQAKADFDHTLYLRPRDTTQMLPRGWDESPQLAGKFMKVKQSQELVKAGGE